MSQRPANVDSAVDNGSGVAALLELADRFKDAKMPRSIRFVAFVNEEPPHYMAGTISIYFYARQAVKRNDNIVAMYFLETIAIFHDVVGSQHYPLRVNFFYPNQGNFIAFVSTT